MRLKHSKLRMGFRGRSGLLTCLVFGTAVVIMVYYAWNNYFRSPSRISSYSSEQGLLPGQGDQWDKDRQPGFVVEDPPIGLNKEIEMQMANEKWKKAKALQDRIDEERLAEERAAQTHGKGVDNILKTNNGNPAASAGQKELSHPLLFREADALDGDYFSKLERIVHLDLKGAPPLVSYLEKLFPLLTSLGATGVLMEYEDMFPYSGNLSMLAAANAYSLSDMQRIQAAAKASGLEIIPLVQTFGHMEFVLKYKGFIGLREHEYTPQVITPVKQESYTLIFKMLEQVLKAHPNSRRIHLGCDEVYGLGQGQSNTYMTSQRLTPGQLFLEHVVKIARHLKTKYPQIQSLIWDDWLRKISHRDLRESGLPSVVEPVVWYYQHNILERVPPQVWDKYGNLFSGVWVASAFKGATGSAQTLTNASLHLDNNLQWVSIVRKFGVHSKMVTFRGLMFTGWQRYDHFATLCELLPVGLPSLALSLQAVRHGRFGPEEMDRAGHVLQCSHRLDLEFPALGNDGARVTPDCSFPGSSVLYGVQQLWGVMELFRRDVGLQERISGWMKDHHVQQGISSPGQMKILAHKVNKVMGKLQELVKPMRNSLLEIYDKWTIDEWMTANIGEQVNHMKVLYEKARKLLESKEWPGRPFPEPAGERAAAQMGAQSASQNFPAQPNSVALQGPHSVNGRLQINGNGLKGQDANAALNTGRLGQQGVGMGQRQSGGNARFMGSQGGALSQALLNRQVLKDGSLKDQLKLRQYVPGLPEAQKQPPSGQKMYMFNQNPGQQPLSGQNMYRVNQNLGKQPSRPNLYQVNQNPDNQLLPRQNLYGQGVRANPGNQLQNQQNERLEQTFHNQQVQKPKYGKALEQKHQGPQQNRPELTKKSQPGQEGSLKQQGPARVQGPLRVGNQPEGQQQMPPLRDQRAEGKRNKTPLSDARKELNMHQLHPPHLPLPAREKHNSGKDLINSDRYRGGQEGAALMDSFVGRKAKDENVININGDENPEEDADTVIKEHNDYDADGDEAA